MKIKNLLFACPCIFLFFACCATTKPKQAENSVDIATDAANDNEETIVVNNITVNSYFTEETEGKPFDTVDFLRYLNGGMEVVKVYHDSNIDKWIRMPGKEISGRYYFEYQSPLYSKPISSADELLAQFKHNAIIARKLNPAYTINLDMDIRNGESGELEHRTLTFNVRPGIAISDYRREGELRYTLRASDGSLKYGQYLVVSAILIKDTKEADLYHALQAWLKQSETADFSGLFGEIIERDE
jgi:hypothetical protein